MNSRFFPLLIALATALTAALAAAPGARAQAKAIGVAPAPTPGVTGQRWGLVIGINDYVAVPKLRFARQDATALADALVATGAIAPQNLVVMTDARDVRVDRPHLYPTRSNLRNRINRLAEVVGPDDTLLIFYSGHGVNVDGQAYLVPVDGDDRDLGSLVPLRWVAATIEASPATQRLLILDACHAGAKSGPRDSPADGINDAVAGAAFQTLASCGPQELSHEDPKTGHGVFANALIAGLGGAADRAGEGNRDGAITVEELFDYASLEVRRWSFASGKRQTPMLKGQRQGRVTLAGVPAGYAPAPVASKGPAAALAPPRDDRADLEDREAARREAERRERDARKERERERERQEKQRKEAEEERRRAAEAAAPPPVRPTPPRPDPPLPAAVELPPVPDVADDRLTVELLPGRGTVPTAIVHLRPREDAKLSDAVAAAPAGALILVHPGSYAGKTVVDRPLEIRGLGDLGDAELVSNQSRVVETRTDRTVLRNLKLHAGKNLFRADVQALHAGHGVTEVYRCDLASAASTVVQVAPDAELRLRDVRVRDGAGTGVIAGERSTLQLAGVSVYGHEKSGVDLRDGARLEAFHSSFHDNGGHGVALDTDTAATFDGCALYANRGSGLRLRKRADLTARRTRFADNAERGVYLEGAAVALITHCTFADNAGPGVEAREGGDPTVRRSSFTGHTGPAVRLTEKAEGNIYLNDFKDNAGDDVEDQRVYDPDRTWD